MPPAIAALLDIFSVIKNSAARFPAERARKLNTADNNPTRNEFKPIIPALKPPPTLFIDSAMPRRVASLKSKCFSLSLSASTGLPKRWQIRFHLFRKSTSPQLSPIYCSRIILEPTAVRSTIAIMEEIFPNDPEIMVPAKAERKEMTKVIREIQRFMEIVIFIPLIL